MQQGIWTKSSRCAADSPQCVEVRAVDGGVEVRDSKRIDGPSVLAFDADEWRVFVAGVREGDFDLQ